MANKLQKLFSNDDITLSLHFSFEDEASGNDFVNAIKKAIEEGISVQTNGNAILETSIQNGDSICHTSAPMQLTGMTFSPSKEDFSQNILTEFGTCKLPLQLYYTLTHMILETPENAIVYLKTLFRLPTVSDETLPAARFIYRVQPENATSVLELAKGYSTAFTFIQELFGNTPSLTTAAEKSLYDQMKKFFSASIQLFKKLLYIEKKFNITFSPDQLQNHSDNWRDVEEIYYLLQTKKALHLSATVNNSGGNITASSCNDVKIGQTLELTFRSTAEYTIFGQSLTLYTANLLSNAIVKKIEQLPAAQIKILYGDNETNPMYISYTGFLTEEEAAAEMPHIMEHKEIYTEAPELREVLEN